MEDDLRRQKDGAWCMTYEKQGDKKQLMIYQKDDGEIKKIHDANNQALTQVALNGESTSRKKEDIIVMVIRDAEDVSFKFSANQRIQNAEHLQGNVKIQTMCEKIKGWDVSDAEFTEKFEKKQNKSGADIAKHISKHLAIQTLRDFMTTENIDINDSDSVQKVLEQLAAVIKASEAKQQTTRFFGTHSNVSEQAKKIGDEVVRLYSQSNTKSGEGLLKQWQDLLLPDKTEVSVKKLT